MKPQVLATKYDKIAHWWHENHHNSTYGLAQIEKAISFCSKKNKALDVGCGAGGRITNLLKSHGFESFGIDVSKKMIDLAKLNHPEINFEVQDICTWETDQTFDFILAWDSIFHLPLESQAQVIKKLCSMLNPKGVLIYTFGDAIGDHESTWHNDTFYYSSIGMNENLRLLMESDCVIKHVELDQFPMNHVFVVAQKQI